MKDRLIKRIITRGVAGDFDNSEELEHIFEFDDGSKMNISKMKHQKQEILIWQLLYVQY